jgi:hypothetical protein
LRQQLAESPRVELPPLLAGDQLLVRLLQVAHSLAASRLTMPTSMGNFVMKE